ncbi:VWA domain-containing protein [Candidatus Woesearchaeota archaeon]|nr:VWA domain-containing protein [Candidatus Woesearchaeota archaeon]
MVKKGVFFSIDALIAVIIILSAIIFISVFYINKPSTSQQVYFSSDLVQILSTMKIGEINDPAVRTMLNESNITELNRTILEQTLRFQVGGREDEASELINLTIGNLVPDYYNLGVWIEGFEEPVYATSQEPVTQLISSKQLVSGIEKEKAVEGLASRAFLSGINERTSSAYAYFGGYEGDGNITKKVTLPGGLISIDYAYMELDAGGEFDLHINGIKSGHYTPAQDMRADEWVINSSCLSNFQEGENTIIFSFNGTKKYIGGGYLRVDYTASELILYEDIGTERYYFPGIDGIINVYSSFYVPGSLDSMNIHLHYESDYETFMNIGGITVYSYESSGENTVDIPDEELSLIINYSSLSNKTVPIRIGLVAANLSEVIGQGDVDVVLITDLSGSMEYRLDSDVDGIARNCSDPLIYEASTKRVSLAKCLDKDFIDTILQSTRNRVALSAFYGDDSNPYKGKVYEEGLTNNAAYLKGQVDAYSPLGGTCICCAINDAYEILDAQNNESRMKFVIVMSDGIPTHTCQAASGCEGTRTGLPSREGLWLGFGSGCYGGIDDCNVNDCACASQNANWSSCRLHSELNTTVYSIGFGPVASCAMANQTLRNIADCGGGEYYSSDNATILKEIYEGISEKILNVSFRKQTAIISGELSNTFLYPDSYILFNYTPSLPDIEYGRIPITIESPRLGNNITEGTFDVPSKILVYDAKITSYSSDKWTDRAWINSSGNWTSFYDLSSYGDDYSLLGDPYIINIPIGLIEEGENRVRVSTGVNPINSTGGSLDDRIIYTSGIDIDINYTGIFEKAEGCSWFIMFEDGTNITIPIPSEYGGSKNCNFDEDTDCYSDYDDDAIDNAICHLFEQMDFDDDGLLFIKFGPTDLDIETVSIGKIPFMWGPTLVEVRVWK